MASAAGKAVQMNVCDWGSCVRIHVRGRGTIISLIKDRISDLMPQPKAWKTPWKIMLAPAKR